MKAERNKGMRLQDLLKRTTPNGSKETEERPVLRMRLQTWLQGMKPGRAALRERWLPGLKRAAGTLAARWLAWLKRTASTLAEWAVGVQATLHIEDQEVRLVVFRSGRPLRWRSARLPGGIFQDGMVQDPDGLASILDPLFSSMNAPRKQVLLSLGGLHAMVRTITLPELKPSLLPEAVRRELAREVPVPLDDHHLVWQVLGTEEDEMRVLVLALPRAELDGTLAALRKARVHPGLVDWKLLAMARAVNEPSAAIVTMDGGGIEIAITQNGIPAIARAISYTQAAGSVAQRIEQTATELLLTLSYASGAQDEGDQVSAVYLLGRDGGDPAVRERLEDAAGYSVLEPPALLDHGEFPLFEYAANAGLVLRQARNQGLPFGNHRTPARVVSLPDLLPSSWRVHTIPIRQGLVAIALAIALGAVAPPLAESFQADPRLEALRGDIVRVEREIGNLEARLRQEQSSRQEVEALQQELQQWRDGLASLSSGLLRWPDLVRSMSADPTLDAVNINSISEDGTRLTLSGGARSYTDAVRLAVFLDDTGVFGRVALNSLVTDDTEPGQERTAFNVTADKRDNNSAEER